MQFPGLLQFKKTVDYFSFSSLAQNSHFFLIFPPICFFSAFVSLKKKIAKKCRRLDYKWNFCSISSKAQILFSCFFFIPEGKQFISYIMNYCFCFFKLNNSLKLACNFKMNFIILKLYILKKGNTVKGNVYQI